MQRYYLLGKDDVIEAEGCLFDSGQAATSFLDKSTSGIMTWPDIGRARYVHITLGGRRFAWKHGEEGPGILYSGAKLDIVTAHYPDGRSELVVLDHGG